MDATQVIDWNGRDVPEGLRHLPKGRYVIEQLVPRRRLTRAEEEGLIKALDSVEAGRTRSARAVHGRLRSLLGKARRGSKSR
jgi:hypothetical protein